ncbi:MAG: response regulator, partial [Gemmatimonadetes bacterium]|nr:response regulator [Gemmatimonadota bacterium]
MLTTNRSARAPAPAARGAGARRRAAEAPDGDAAVAAIRDWAPDAVFLDIQMPGRDGFQVIAAVGVERMPATVFVTGYDQH